MVIPSAIVILSTIVILSEAKELSAFPGVWLLSERFFALRRIAQDDGFSLMPGKNCQRMTEHIQS